MNITSTARSVFLATALVLAVGAGAQAKSSALDVANSALTVAPGKIHSVHQVKDNDTLLYEVMVDGDDGAMHTIKVDESGKVINHISRTNMTHDAFYASSNGGGSGAADGESTKN